MTTRTVTGGKTKRLKSPAYHEGREARRRQVSFVACPHPCGRIGAKRQDWLTGWLDQKYSYITGL